MHVCIPYMHIISEILLKKENVYDKEYDDILVCILLLRPSLYSTLVSRINYFNQR